MALPLKKTDPQEVAVLTKALSQAAHYWQISNKHLSDIIGLSEATVSRLKKDTYQLERESKPWQLAVIFLRIFRGLDAFMGGNLENERAWLAASNRALGASPLILMRDVEGLTRVLHYLDDLRGQS